MLISRLTIYNTANNKKRVPNKRVSESENVHRLRQQVTRYRRDQAKLKKLAEWNLRSTRSSLKDVEETLQILKDLYGEEALEDPEYFEDY